MSNNNPNATDEEAAKLLEDLLGNMPHSGADSSAAAIGRITEIMNVLKVTTIVSTTQTQDGTLITFTDGSTSLERED